MWCPMPGPLPALSKGLEFPAATFRLDDDAVARYRAAVEDQSLPSLERELGPGLVPPLAVAARVFKALEEHLALPPGSLHTGQEVEFRRVVRVGESLNGGGRVANVSSRGGWLFVAIDIWADDAQGDPILRGRANLMMPQPQGQQERQ